MEWKRDLPNVRAKICLRREDPDTEMTPCEALVAGVGGVHLHPPVLQLHLLQAVFLRGGSCRGYTVAIQDNVFLLLDGVLHDGR